MNESGLLHQVSSFFFFFFFFCTIRQLVLYYGNKTKNIDTFGSFLNLKVRIFFFLDVGSGGGDQLAIDHLGDELLGNGVLNLLVVSLGGHDVHLGGRGGDDGDQALRLLGEENGDTIRLVNLSEGGGWEERD